MYEKIRIIVIQNQLLWSPDKSKHDILLLLSWILQNQFYIHFVAGLMSG